MILEDGKENENENEGDNDVKKWRKERDLKRVVKSESGGLAAFGRLRESGADIIGGVVGKD